MNLTGPQRAIEALLMPHTLTAPATARRLVAQTSACGLRTTSQTVQRGGDRVYAVLLLMAAVVAWWLVLNRQGRRVAQQESQRQTQLLMQEIDSHRRTDAQLQQARAAADRGKDRPVLLRVRQAVLPQHIEAAQVPHADLLRKKPRPPRGFAAHAAPRQPDLRHRR